MQSEHAEPIAAPEAQDDERLVAAAQSDPAAFERLYDRYVQPIYRYAYSRMGNRAEAEDITSQTFVNALDALPRYQHRGHFDAWLFSIARNQVRDHYRRRQSDLNNADGSADARVTQGGRDRDDALVGLRSALEALPEGERELIRLRYAAGLTFGRMASVLGRNEEAVKKALYRLLARVKEQVEGRDG